MRLSLSVLTLILASCLIVSFGWVAPAAWADGEVPSALFDVHCAGCHPNGANIIRRGKNLKQRALSRHGYDSAEKIATLIANGKGLMSAYKTELTEQEINVLADYVLQQAANNWRIEK